MSNSVVFRDIDCKGINVADLIKYLLDKTCESFEIKNDEGKKSIVLAKIKTNLRNNEVVLQLKIEYDETTIYEICLQVISQYNFKSVDYTTDLKLYYYENINVYEAIQAIREENETPKTVRIYKLIYNNHPIYGTFSFNMDRYNIKFHTINVIERMEPLTEHVVAFDVKVKSKNIQDARGKAYNLATEFSNYLSVLLDISFYDPQSVYRNFVRLSKDRLAQRIITHERYRTGFIDSELEIVVKDNMNGMATLEDVKEGLRSDSGVVSITNPENSDISIIEKYGNIDHIEKVFENHRLEKVPDNTKAKYADFIEEDIFIQGQEILIPKCIRKYYRGIDGLSLNTKKAFRNAARLYNKSAILGMEQSTLQISFLVASIETLASNEKISYSKFMEKYNPSAAKSDIDDMYEIRSKLFHSGEFSFFEYEVSMNPYINPVYEYMADKYFVYRRILRKTIINWINKNIIDNDV